MPARRSSARSARSHRGRAAGKPVQSRAAENASRLLGRRRHPRADADARSCGSTCARTCAPRAQARRVCQHRRAGANHFITGAERSKPDRRCRSRSRRAGNGMPTSSLQCSRSIPTNFRKSSLSPSSMASPVISTGSPPKPRRIDRDAGSGRSRSRGPLDWRCSSRRFAPRRRGRRGTCCRTSAPSPSAPGGSTRGRSRPGSSSRTAITSIGKSSSSRSSPSRSPARRSCPPAR